ncbi:MAG: hypothetical protein V1929_09105 [bacterium]
MAGKPLRVIVAKYRRHGISTWVQSWFEFMCKMLGHWNCRTVAQTDEAASEIFSIAKLMYRADGQRLDPKDDLSKRLRFRETHSTYRCSTGLGRFTGSGATFNAIHVSEYAKFETRSEQDRHALASLENAVARNSPESCIIIESSGQGAVGDFPGRCRAASKGLGEFACVFIPWTLDPALALDEDELPDEFEPLLAGDELTLQRDLKATEGQLAWRRREMMTKFPGIPFSVTPPSFGWDYPSTLEECFGQKSGRIYPTFGARNYGRIDRQKVSEETYCTRFVDWGGSENHAFVCLWCLVDPSKPPQLIVDSEACPHFVEEHLGYSRDPKTGGRRKEKDDTCDALRIGVATLGLECLVYVYRELWVVDPVEAIHSRVARRIHQMSGWYHPSGEPEHPDISLHEAGEKADEFRFGGNKEDGRFDWSHWGGQINEELQKAIELGAGVADASQYRNCLQFTRWGIPLIPHVKPPGPSREGAVEDGIGMVNRLIAGDTTARTERLDFRRGLLDSALKKQKKKRPEMLTDEEAEAYREAHFGAKKIGSRSKDEEEKSLTGWMTCG